MDHEKKGMLHYEVEEKRVVVMDIEIQKEGISEEAWQTMMKMILGRHYGDLNKKGPGWSFPRYALEKFQALLAKEMALPVFDSAPPIRTKDSSSQTTVIDTSPKIHRYKHDISEELIQFGRSWLP